MFGPDAKASLTIEATAKLVKGVRQITEAMQAPSLKHDNSNFNELRNMFGKSLAVNKSLPAEHIISIYDLESKKPGNIGIPTRNYQSVIGKKLRIAKQQGDFLKEEDIA